MLSILHELYNCINYNPFSNCTDSRMHSEQKTRVCVFFFSIDCKDRMVSSIYFYLRLNLSISCVLHISNALRSLSAQCKPHQLLFIYACMYCIDKIIPVNTQLSLFALNTIENAYANESIVIGLTVYHFVPFKVIINIGFKSMIRCMINCNML